MGEKIKANIPPKIFFYVFFLAILLLAFYMAKPFLPALITGALIAYLSYPLYKKTLHRIKNESWAACIVTVFIVILFTVPTVIMASLVFKEAQYYSVYLGPDSSLGTNFMKMICKNEDWSLCRATKNIFGLLPNNDPDFYLNAAIQKIKLYVTENIDRFISSILSLVFDFFIMLFVIYYFYKDGDLIYRRVKQLLPVREDHKERIFNRFHDITKAVFYGNISTSILQAFLGSIAFLLLGVPSPFFWGAILGLFAFIPYIGTAIIWLPAALNLIFLGYIQNSNVPIINGTILLLYGIFVLSVVDHFLKPKLIGDKAEVHPLLVLIGVLGGLKMFGFIGLILGPVILALIITFVDIYEEEKQNKWLR